MLILTSVNDPIEHKIDIPMEEYNQMKTEYRKKPLQEALRKYIEFHMKRLNISQEEVNILIRSIVFGYMYREENSANVGKSGAGDRFKDDGAR